MRRHVLKSDVILNIYDLSDNNSLYPFGLGLYHSGVHIDNKEYTFAAESGIFYHSPKSVPNAKFRESIKIGVFEGPPTRIEDIISELRSEFKGSDYNVVFKNCNCFSDAFVKKLVNKEIPSFVNRMANIGEYCSCLLPSSIANPHNVDPATSPLVAKDTRSFGGRGYKLTDS